MSGTYARRTTTITASMLSGWITPSRITVFTISIITAILKDRRSPAATSAGIPWWTTDIGGFMTDDVNDPDFQQLLIRWYEFAVYSAVLRMHGDRGPYNIPMLDDRDFGGGCLHTGQPNELWSYGEENYKIMKKYYDIRIEMHDYIKKTVRRGIRERTRDGKVYEGGQTIHADAPIDSIPVFKRK